VNLNSIYKFLKDKGRWGGGISILKKSPINFVNSYMLITNIILVSKHLPNCGTRAKNKKFFLKILYLLKNKLLIIDIKYDIFKYPIYCDILNLLITANY